MTQNWLDGSEAGVGAREYSRIQKSSGRLCSVKSEKEGVVFETFAKHEQWIGGVDVGIEN